MCLIKALSISDWVFAVEAPKGCSGHFGRWYRSISDALDACVSRDNKHCHAVEYDYHHNRFRMARSSNARVANGKACMAKSGHFVESNGYMWDYRPDTSLTGYFNDVVYKTDREAYAVCAASTDCKGVTMEAGGRYRLNSDVKRANRRGQKSFIQGSK